MLLTVHSIYQDGSHQPQPDDSTIGALPVVGVDGTTLAARETSGSICGDVNDDRGNNYDYGPYNNFSRLGFRYSGVELKLSIFQHPGDENHNHDDSDLVGLCGLGVFDSDHNFWVCRICGEGSDSRGGSG